MISLGNDLDPHVDASHLAAVRVVNAGGSVVGPSSDELGQDVRDGGDLDLDGGLAPVHAGVQGSGAGLALGHMGGAQEVRKLGQEIVSIILAKMRNYLKMHKCA